MNGIVHNIMGVQSVSKVTCYLLHGDAPALIVLAEVHVELVWEGKAQENCGQKHLDGDEEVLVGSRFGGAVEEIKPLQDGQEKACVQNNNGSVAV